MTSKLKYILVALVTVLSTIPVFAGIMRLPFALLAPLPALGHLSAYNLVLPGRARLPYGENPAESYNLSPYNIPAMLASHEWAGADEGDFNVLLVGDSAANVVYGYDSTVPITIDELIPLVRAVVRGAPHALVVADLPFGSYEGGPAQALATATRFMKEGGAHAVKLEGGERVADQIATLSAAGIPVMAHIGFTPQSVNTLGGFRVQGRGDAAEQTVHDAIAVAEAGAFAVVMEMVPAELATQITGKLTIPTVGIGAGPNCDAQVLVWQDMAGMTAGKTARFVKRFGDVGGELRRAAEQYAHEVATGAFPAEEHCF